MHLFSALAQRAIDSPDAVFCHFCKGGSSQVVTVGAIMAQARAIAGDLHLQGVVQGQVVPIILEHRPELYSSFIACTLLGAQPAFLPPLTRKQDPVAFAAGMEALFRRLSPPCVIASAQTRAGAPSTHVVDLDDPKSFQSPPFMGEPAAAPGDVAFLQHSSGTTGLRKGVLLSHQTVLHQIEVYARAIEVLPGDVVASWLPLYHDMGLITCFLMPAVLGLPIISLDALEWVMRPGLLLDAVQHHRASLVWLPNFALQHSVRLVDPNEHWDLSSLRMVINCSEPCRAAAFDAFQARFASCNLREFTLHASYAMAENVFAVTQTKPGTPVRRSEHADHPGITSSGRPVPGTQLRIVTSSGTPATNGELGEIEITGSSLFSGYQAQPELTTARMRDGWYRTGDLGFINDGELFVVGRSDDVLNVNGKKLVAHEIEDTLNDLPGLAPGRILVYDQLADESGANHLIVAVEALGVADAALASAIRRRVLETSGVRPHRVDLLERGFLLKSTSGKISRAASIAKLNSRSRSE